MSQLVKIQTLMSEKNGLMNDLANLARFDSNYANRIIKTRLLSRLVCLKSRKNFLS